MKEWAKKFYNSKKWRCCRAAYISQRIQIDGGLCEVCHERTGYIVHHKILLDSGNIGKPDIALNPHNLMYVCKDCHDQFEGHFYDGKTVRPAAQLAVCFDANGYPEPKEWQVKAPRYGE